MMSGQRFGDARSVVVVGAIAALAAVARPRPFWRPRPSLRPWRCRALQLCCVRPMRRHRASSNNARFPQKRPNLGIPRLGTSSRAFADAAGTNHMAVLRDFEKDYGQRDTPYGKLFVDAEFPAEDGGDPVKIHPMQTHLLSCFWPAAAPLTSARSCAFVSGTTAAAVSFSSATRRRQAIPSAPTKAGRS
ncbi:unnamed protein product [Prorocentrum cordatum]|uniref:Uncharacterized protein n=1 Tax=Prorocentrum cordatum TaxID=2364126 RepID=A0ABN9VQD5_9DINO|nr:unnamed protein product [Polarella glacialis]